MKRRAVSLVLAVLLAVSTGAVAAHAQANPLTLGRSLMLGSSGSDVSALQQFLKEREFFAYPSITGYFGSVTKSAVSSFQQAFGIESVGIAGPITRLKILELTSQVAVTATTSIPVSQEAPSRRRSHSSHVDSIAPDAPTEVSASNITLTTLVLSWAVPADAGGSGVSGYRIERCTGGGCSDFVHVSTQNSPSFSDSGLTADTVYRYRVRAVDAAGNLSDYSSISDATTLPMPTYLLSLAKAGSGSGTITSTPAGINCGSTCSSSFAPDTVVTLSASPAAGSAFSGWSGGGCSGTGSCMVTMSAAATVTATFSLNTYALTVIKAGPGAGTITSTPAGIACGSTCSASYSSGTMVTLTAFATNGFFNGWSGGGCSGTGSCTVPMSAATTVTATFQTLEDA